MLTSSIRIPKPLDGLARGERSSRALREHPPHLKAQDQTQVIRQLKQTYFLERRSFF
jgi:hypothetical protein